MNVDLFSLDHSKLDYSAFLSKKIRRKVVYVKVDATLRISGKVRIGFFVNLRKKTFPLLGSHRSWSHKTVFSTVGGLRPL